MGALAVQFVGAGPGAADLLTVRAARLLAGADVVLYPGSYLDPTVLAHCSQTADLVDTADLDLDAIVGRIVTAHRAGRAVVRLVSGDPSLYSAVFEQTRRLDRIGDVGDRPAQHQLLRLRRARDHRDRAVPAVPGRQFGHQRPDAGARQV
ncbi:SAM-dependent methyltransferase, partial [Mycolicibacter icosiumassiliensis]|uniref:SAM-dependent methyltransferase n=1 Tax=Mycolicibacter icosiumassiliensis TaxID=1792835 RepID=UPI000A5929F6